MSTETTATAAQAGQSDGQRGASHVGSGDLVLPSGSVRIHIENAKAAGCENADQITGYLAERLNFWIAEAAAIAKERGELFRAGEAMRAAYVADATDKPRCVDQWDEAAQPVRDMIASLGQNASDEPRGQNTK